MNLLDAFQQTLQPVSYAQNRFTQAPTFIAKSPDTAEPDTGLTTTDSPTIWDKAQTILRSITQGINPNGLNIPKNKGTILLSPDAASARHESAHSVLQNAGVSGDTYSKVLDDLGPVGRRMRDSFNQSNRAGDAIHELPAYMVEYANKGKTPLLGIAPDDRDAYLQQLQQELKTKHGSKVANTFRRLYP